MGGKNKPNRTKNNARPSSSARSAELLGNQTPTFFGMGAVKDGANGAMSMLTGLPTTAEEVDVNIIKHFELALKKMVKKDATTKLKALQEFSELCRKAEVSEVKAILPFWPLLYSQLCGDTEHRVREAAHQSHKAVISRVKKHLAPYLKEIIGPWFTSQYDTYAPAASAAVAAFQEAFSPQKMAEAVAFCQEEILNYLHHNLNVHTPQTLSNPKVHSAEEMEDKYRRVVTSSLLGYALYLQKVTPEQLQVGEEINKRLISCPRFWKLGQHKDPLVRHSFLTALIALCQHAPSLLATETPKLAGAIFNHLNEDDPLVLPAVWDAVLHGVIAVPECWNHSNVEKQLIPKLLQILRGGGKGHAANIFPKMLPLLSKLPPKAMGDKTAFLDHLFSSMRAGLLEASVNRSQSESRVVASTFVECLQYMVMVNREDTALVHHLIKNHLMVAIETQLSSPTSQLTTVPLACHIAQLLRSWCKNAPTYNAVTDQCWLVLEQVFQNMIQTCHCQEGIETVLKNQTDFLAILKTPSKFKPKNRERVTFSTTPNEAPVASIPVTDTTVPLFDESLQMFAQSIASKYIEQFKSTDNSMFLKALLDHGQSFGSKAIFGSAAGNSELLELFSQAVEKNVEPAAIVGLGVHLLPHLSDEVQRKVLGVLAERDDVDLVQLSRGLLSSSASSVRSWIREKPFSKLYLNLVDKYLCGETDAAAGDVIYGYLAPELLIGTETCKKTFSMIEQHLVTSYSAESPNCSRISLLIEACGKDACLNQEFEDVVSRLFCASCGLDGESYDHLLRLALTKVKYFRVKDPADWISLAARLARDIWGESLVPLVVYRVVGSVNNFLQVACDSDLMETCEVEELQEAIPFLQVFLEPPIEMRQCAATLKRLALMSCEVSGDCSLEYFKLKARPIQTTRMAPDDDVLASSPADRELMRAYRSAYVAGQEQDNSPSPLRGNLVESYLQWLQINTMLMKMFLGCYPVQSQIDDILIPGRYILEGEENAVEDTSPSSQVEDDVIPRPMSADKWTTLKEEAEVLSVFPREDYPDQLSVLPLGNRVLDILENCAVLDVLQKFYPELEYYPIISSMWEELMEKVQDMVSTGTPSDVHFLYCACQALVVSEASWCALETSLSTLIFRRFRSLGRPTPEQVAEAIAGAVAAPSLEDIPSRVFKLTAAVKRHAHLFTLDNWNAIFIQLEQALKALNAYEDFREIDQAKLVESAAISSFFVVTRECFLSCLERAEDEKLLPELVIMWDDIVEKELWLQLFAYWRKLIPLWQPAVFEHDQAEGNESGVSEECTADPVVAAEEGDFATSAITEKGEIGPVLVRRLSEAVVAGLSLRPVEVSAVALAEQCSQLLLCPQVALQITAFRLLLSLVPELVQVDTQVFQDSLAETPQNEDKALFTRTRDCDWMVKQLAVALRTSQTVVDALLSDLKTGDTCTVQPFTDAFTYAHGYLLLWCVVMEMCGEAHVALRFQYAAWLRSNGYLTALLKSTFNLMPAYVIHGETARDTAPLFETYGSLKLGEAACSGWVEQRACFTYRMCLQRLPAAVREWWSEADHHVGSLVARATSIHVSPLLIASELKAVQNEKMAELENITVAVSPAAREVVGTYVVDEAAMQIIISLPANYPLGTIKVDFKASSKIPRAWRISMFLVHRNGSLRDALALWKSDLDKKFEGVEECEICFSIIQGPNFDIPKQACSTCRKKFHSACLLKWFSTSNKSSCPHCRNQY